MPRTAVADPGRLDAAVCLPSRRDPSGEGDRCRRVAKRSGATPPAPASAVAGARRVRMPETVGREGERPDSTRHCGGGGEREG